MKAAATKRFVLDASVIVAWCFEDESERLSEAVLDALIDGAEAVVPTIWPLEVANALLMGERRGRISVAQVTALLRRIAGLPVAVEAVNLNRAFEQVVVVARQASITEYDASYLELCMRQALPFATLDAKLREAAKDLGVTLVTA